MAATVMSIGDVAIIAANTEDTGNPQKDLISFILLKPIGSGTVIYFTDRAWNGTVFAAAGGGDGTFTYTAGADLPAGTVVTITQAQLTLAGINLSEAGDTIYAYQGTTPDAPTRFLHAVDIGDATAGFPAGSLTNTGLVDGTSAVALGTGAGILDVDNAEFGGRTHNIQAADLFARINTASSWTQNSNSPQDGTADGTPAFTAPDAQLWIAGSGAGSAIVTINLDGTYNTGTLGYQIVQAFQNQNATATFHPSDITLDTVEDKFFFVDSDAGGHNRIIQGSISQLLSSPGAAMTFTVLYSNAGLNANGIIDSLSIDTVNNKIYFDVGTTTTGSTINRINYNTASQTPTVLATLGSGQYVTQMAIDYTRGEVFVAVSQITSGFGSDFIDNNYVYRATAPGGTAAGLASTATLTFTTIPFSPNDSGFGTEGGPLGGNAFPVERGNIKGLDVDPVTHALVIVTGSVILDNDGNGLTTYNGGIYRYALDANPTGTYTTLYQQTGTPGAAGTGPRGLLYYVEVDAATGRYYVVDTTGLNAANDDASVWSGSLTVPGTPTFLATVANFNGLGGLGLEILHAPTLTAVGVGAAIFETAGNPSPNPVPLLLGSTFTSGDVDSAGSTTDQLAGAQVRITGNFQTGVGHADFLLIGGATSGTLGSGIAFSYNAVTGVLTLSGINTFANYNAALNAVQFRVDGDNPTNYGTAGSRTFAVSVFDGALYSDEVTASVGVIASNDAPTSTGLQGDSVTTTEPAGLGSVMPGINIDAGGNMTFADVDNLNFNGGTLRVAITAGKQAVEDQLLIDTSGTVTIAANVVSVGGVAIGTRSGGGAGGGDLVIALTANATPALIQTVVRAVFYGNTGNDNPTAGARTITTTLIDGGGVANSGTDTLTITSTVNVVATDDASVAVADPINPVNENVTVAISVLGNDTDPDTTLTAVNITQIAGVAATVGNAVALASGATAILNANGTITYNPNGRFNTLIDLATAAATGAVNTSATDSFTYTLAGGSSTTATVQINGIQSSDDRLLGTAGNNTISGTALGDFFDFSQGGNDTGNGLGGDDAFFFGAAFTALDTADGGAGTNDQIGLLGNYSGGLTLGATTMTNVEVLAVQPGFSYSITSNDANVGAGQTLSVFGGGLLAGNNFTFNGSAETNGFFRMFGGLGNDNFTGGALDDGFYFGPGKWDNVNDTVVGGGGTNDQLALDGNYTVSIGANAGVETLALLTGPIGTPNTFNITLLDVWTGAAATKTVWGAQVTTAMTINGSAETNGNLIFFGGTNTDTLTGGAGADAISGGGGGDALRGNGGADIFRYDSITDSNGTTNATRDRILDFTTGSDKIDLSRIDAIDGGADDAFSFIGSGAFTNVAGQLRYTDVGGGVYIVEGDVNGDGIADFTLSVTTAPAAAPVPTDFIL